MKSLTKFFCLIALPLIIGSCGGNNSANDSNDLKVGGLYLFKTEKNTYRISKILVIDDFAVHVRTYSDTFQTKPTDISSENLKILVGHAPIDKNGFLIDKPELLKVEKVKDSELEGYKMYQESMGN